MNVASVTSAGVDVLQVTPTAQASHGLGLVNAESRDEAFGALLQDWRELKLEREV